MVSSLFAWIATAMLAGGGPIPQRLGAKLLYEARLPYQVGFVQDSFSSQSGSAIRPYLQTRLEVTVMDTSRSDSGLVWGLALKIGLWKSTVHAELLQRRDNSWTWLKPSCLFPVDVEPGFPSRTDMNKSKTYQNLDYYGALALGCTERFQGGLPWRPLPASLTNSSLYGSTPIAWSVTSSAFVGGLAGPPEKRWLIGFEFYVSLTPQSKAYREGVGWVRVEDVDAGRMMLKLLAVDGQTVPESWDPPPPPTVYPVLTPQPRPQAGSIWVWRSGKTSIRQDIGIILSSDSSFDDTLVAKLLEVRDSAGWTVGRFHHRDGIDAPPRNEFTLIWNDTTVRGELDSASALLRSSLVRPKVCWHEDRCEAPTTNSWSNGLLGNSKETSTTRSGMDWTFGVGVTFSGISQSGFHGNTIFADSDGWFLLFGPDSLRATTTVDPRRSVHPNALSELAQGNPEAPFTIWTLRGDRQILSGSALAAMLPSLRGPLLWSVRLDGTLRTGKHLRP